MVAAADKGAFPNKTISVAGLANQLNISQAKIERVFIHSLLQKQDFELDYGAGNGTDDKSPYVNPRGIILGNAWIEKFNESAPDDKKLRVGQRLDVKIQDGGFFLAPSN